METAEKTDAQWREELTPEQYQVLRKAGTERAFTGKYWDTKDAGTYKFTEPKVAEAVEVKRDISHGMIRTEVVCKRCDGHLGHVFEDGPRDRGGLRFCMNSCAMEFDPATK